MLSNKVILSRYLLPKTATAKIEPLSYSAAAYSRLFKQCNQKKIKCLNAFATFFLFKLMTKGSNNIAKRSFLFQVKKKRTSIIPFVTTPL